MLKSLYIKNYALIDSLDIDFESGFSVITGETGAGKSIILGALSLILGQRADIKSIKNGEDKCIIEGVFDVSNYDLKEFCEQNDIDYDEHSYIIRREILSSGKSRAFINDSPVSLTDLKDLGSQLIDIHSQHKNLLIGDSRFQLQVVDIIANSKKDLEEYKLGFSTHRKAEKELANLIELIEKEKQDQDYIRFQFDTLLEAKLKDEDEQTELEKELSTLNHAEDIKSALHKIHTLLASDDGGILPLLKESLLSAQSLDSIFSKSGDIIPRIESAYIDLKDLSPEVERYAEDIEFSPERLSFIQERLDTIYSLQQKYKVGSIAELINLQADFEQKLQALDSSDEQIELLRKSVSDKHKTMLALAKKLSDKRKVATPKIEKYLVEKVKTLGIPNIQFSCEIAAKDPDSTGVDDLAFMFSANKNTPLQPISEVASGGEISRIMLSLKALIAGATALPSIIFDEIDTGVSGEVADKMGEIMEEFGTQMQVITITHLPQIAAKGKAHYFVYKLHDANSSTTSIKRLSDDERVKEIAQMLSGSTITDAAIENAKVMLKK